MFSLRTKLVLGFGSLLSIMIVIGLMIISQLDHLGVAIDVILRENYRSVIACQNMKEALERIDSGLLMQIAGNRAQGDSLIDANQEAFTNAYTIEKHNITLPGEKELVDSLSAASARYLSTVAITRCPNQSPTEQRRRYFEQALPQFSKTKDIAQKILELNQRNMDEANNTARREATLARSQMLFAILVSTLVALLFSVLTQAWVLRPIRRLSDSIREVEAGNLELVLHSNSRDEVGRLTIAFNQMTLALRERRRTDQVALIRTRRATEEIINTLPAAIAVTDRGGQFEIVTDKARKQFGLKQGETIQDCGFPWLVELFQKTIRTGEMAELPPEREFIRATIDSREYFYQPAIIPIPGDSGEISGIVVMFRDMTEFHEHQVLKRNVAATVSHQLKVPLTSLRMALHLLQDTRFGALNARQEEFVGSAQEESDKLSGIIDDLLDIQHIADNPGRFEKKPIDPTILVRDAVDPFLDEARNKGIELQTEFADYLPRVRVDASQFTLVLTNLLSNAVAHTPMGGTISVSVVPLGEKLRFSVSDSGPGIAPEHQKRLFEQFYQVPGSVDHGGSGLGLAIAREIVLAHEGEIGVESEPGKGATFWVDLKPIQDSNISVTYTGGQL